MTRHPHLRLIPEDPEPGFPGRFGRGSAMTIDCAVCAARATDACDDCVVSFLVGHEAGTPVVLEEQEQRFVDLLAGAGLVPASRYDPRPGVA